MEGTEFVYSYKIVILGKQLTNSSKFKGSELSDTWRHLEKVMNISQQLPVLNFQRRCLMCSKGACHFFLLISCMACPWSTRSRPYFFWNSPWPFKNFRRDSEREMILNGSYSLGEQIPSPQNKSPEMPHFIEHPSITLYSNLDKTGPEPHDGAKVPVEV